jgi:hypothetical protein
MTIASAGKMGKSGVRSYVAIALVGEVPLFTVEFVGRRNALSRREVNTVFASRFRFRARKRCIFGVLA